MAKSVGFIGGISGKIGNVVFGGTAKNGEAIMRKYNPTPHNPKSARQQRSRALVAEGCRQIRMFLPAIRLGWQDSAPSRQFQKAMSMILPWRNGFFTEQSGDIFFNQNKLQEVLSEKQLNGMLGVSEVDFDTASHVTFKLNVPEGMGKDEHGNPIGVGIVATVYTKDLEEVFVEQIVGDEGVNSVDIEVPLAWSGLDCDVWVFVKQIPNSANGITSTTTPWMYPSKTSGAIKAAHGTIN